MCAAMSRREGYRLSQRAQSPGSSRDTVQPDGREAALDAVALRLHQEPQARRMRLLLDPLPRARMTEPDPTIFKAYDVRGTHPDQIDADLAYRLGRAFARVLGELEGKPPAELSVALGRDMRLSAPEMAARYADGLADEGVDVLDAGRVGTEIVYYAVGSRDLDGGLACTASHNPKAYTGVKLVRRGALPLSGDTGIGELRDLVLDGEPGPPAEPRGQVTREDV